MINLFQPSLGQDELDEIKKVFDSNWIGKGRVVREFEEKFSKSLKTDAIHFLSTTSCTEAIYLSSDIFDFNCDDEIIVPSISFPSIGSAVVSKGAKIVFCDVDIRSLNVRAQDIEKHITTKTKAVFITHYGGVSCDMDDILCLCKENNIKVIEDSACAVRSFYKGKACGTIGDMGMWSFDAMKTLCTSDGGMIYIKDKALKDIAQEQLYLGLPAKQKSGVDSSSEGNASWWEFEINRPGRRAIMNDVTAAMGCAQLKKLETFISRRKEIYNKYYNSLIQLDWIDVPPIENYENESSYYFFLDTDRKKR
ncbi:aminotransferase class V-fold PLP-dependent enzyme [Sulfurimonas sp. MAG313]|nr:aminotransferase class V-fold PLP-dependent enzyme [Sulfurimonas sp. MAG313]MDF1882122.1 aminotransferase class V-fold PLP-dependent enzyme [Sulfurimonas sp. MAG313]